MHCTCLHRSSNLFLQQFSVFYKDIYLNRQIFHCSFLIQWTQIFPCCENITVQKLNWSRCWWLFLFYELKCTTNFPAMQSRLEYQQQQIRYTRVIWLKTSNKTKLWKYEKICLCKLTILSWQDQQSVWHVFRFINVTDRIWIRVFDVTTLFLGFAWMGIFPPFLPFASMGFASMGASLQFSPAPAIPPG